VQRVLDLGGGSGAYSIAFAQAQPGLKAEVLDLPEVVGLTRGYAQAAGVSDRVTARAGDFEQPDYGDDYDLVWISQVCHMLSPEENLEMLHKAFAALAPGGCVAVQEFLLDPDRAGPPQAALFALNMLVGTTRGDAYTEAEISGWLEEVGLREITCVRLPGNTSLVVGRK
jgi:cyclopropane fatty-acyl-phospholipid synthase-like methyltransferase